ncbi:CAF17-like 4Fe-4S cluster assembly/insertion protein YgfZ [Marinobacterium weihaiense]|uniref:Folate-binding protein n=1 Tax=Marinobacterium weihaiense TaxID=2851016 RepID=A0ABS6MCU1_9GAMM|nr:folate-binding protein [Marinobacterium weihaiense]MBV0934109.1 folate-binding protein [Marinobacterium weihaiense]
MHEHWLEWLQQPGIQLDNDAVSAAPTHDRPMTLVPLTDAAIIRVAGADAQRFLQGQLSCDLADVDRRGSLPGAHCNIKGHMHSLYQVIHAGPDCYWLRTRRDMTADALTLLKKYIIFSKAEAELSNDLLGFGLIGTGAAALAEQLSEHTDTAAVVHADGLAEVWCGAEVLEALLTQVSQQAGLGTRNDWELANVNAAIPELFPATREAFIPQMVNLQVFDGVSFTKGCYTGQEIVTRLQHRGQLKRPMYLAEVAADTCPAAGTTLASGNKDNVGKIVRSATCAAGRYRVLAVIVKDQAEQQTIRLETSTGPVLTLATLPYELDPQLFESKR